MLPCKGARRGCQQISQQKLCRPGQSGMIYSKCQKGKPANQEKYLAKLLRIEGELKTFPKRQKVEGVTTRPDLQEMLRVLQAEMKGCYLVM